jgi:hypothetical protein
VAVVRVRRVLLAAPVAVRVRRSPAVSLRIRPTVIARDAEASPPRDPSNPSGAPGEEGEHQHEMHGSMQRSTTRR